MKFSIAPVLLAALTTASPTKFLGTRNELARRQAEEPAPFGFATLNGGTTGGAGGETVTVSDLDALTEAAESDGPLTIIVSGEISGSAKIRVAADKTIYGDAGSCKFSSRSLSSDASTSLSVCLVVMLSLLTAFRFVTKQPSLASGSTSGRSAT